jgi:Triosephosphate isomerase
MGANCLTSQTIVCIGETLEQRESGELWKVLEAQLNAVADKLSTEDWDGVVVAYEPVRCCARHAAVAQTGHWSAEQLQCTGAQHAAPTMPVRRLVRQPRGYAGMCTHQAPALRRYGLSAPARSPAQSRHRRCMPASASGQATRWVSAHAAILPPSSAPCYKELA